MTAETVTAPQENTVIREALDHVADDQRNEFNRTGWWHSIDLGNGLITPGVHRIAELRDNYARFGLPDEMRGMRLLDIGCWDGFYSFESERRGAEVVSVDCWRPEKFFEAHRALNSKIRFHENSVYELSPQQLGTFDVVLFLGVLYHLRHPLLALERVCELTRHTAVIESHVIDNALNTPRPVMEFYEIDELGGQYDNWWGPNTQCLEQMIRSAGFVETQVLRREPTRSVIKASRHFSRSLESLPVNMQIQDAINACTLDVRFPVKGKHAYIAAMVEGMPAEASRSNIQIEVGGLGALPIYVGPSGNPKHKGLTQITFPVPPGLNPGHTTLRIAFDFQKTALSEIEMAQGTEW
jgi:tRNA (mo5U34)-methyltransferase